MILLTLLIIIMIILTVITIAVVSVAGAGFIVIFSDVIVCVFIIGWLIKKLIDRKK